MAKKSITVHVRMDLPILRRFAVFNDILLRRRYVSPLTFAGIMMFFSIICFFSGKEQSWLLGTVLAVIGLGMPITYFGIFFFQLRARAKKMKLPQNVYTLNLGVKGVHIVNDLKDEPPVDLTWDKIDAAIRRKGVIYLYATPVKAFILPDGQGDASGDELWALLCAQLPKGRALTRIPRLPRKTRKKR